jgi:uncharacterized protein YjbI with pentapeptide repeats
LVKQSSITPIFLTRRQQSDSIDITHVAIALIKYRLSDSFRLKEKRDYDVIDEPTTAAATARSPINWSLRICFVALLTIIFASAVVPQTGAQELNPAEKWVVAQVTAGEIADLTKKFPEEKDRKLSAPFLEELLTGALPNLKLHRHGGRIKGAIIDEPIDLENAQISFELRLDHCQFNKNVTFAGATFSAGLLLDGSRFKGEARFDGMKVRGHAYLHGSVFEGLASFLGADVAGNFEPAWAKFQLVVFYGMKVGGEALLVDSVFEGPVFFTRADIAGNFDAARAKFQNKQMAANFSGMKVRGDASFSHSVFEGPVDLTNADFGKLDLSDASWPKVAAKFQMQGMSYKYVRAASEEPESHKLLLNLADQPAYSADVYSNLEEFFLRQGYRSDADKAFIAGKRRERKEKLHGLDWLGSWLLDWLVGYGRRPWQAGIPCAVFVALGCVLFSPAKMELQKPEDMPRVYSRFWYSLGVFLPFVDLQADKVWKPKEDQTFLRNYMRVHILLGWILVPLVLAALTGLIK